MEVHNDPAHAMSDGPQSLKPEKFGDNLYRLIRVRKQSDIDAY